MRAVLRAAKERGVAVGAHPASPTARISGASGSFCRRRNSMRASASRSAELVEIGGGGGLAGALCEAPRGARQHGRRGARDDGAVPRGHRGPGARIWRSSPSTIRRRSRRPEAMGFPVVREAYADRAYSARRAAGAAADARRGAPRCRRRSPSARVRLAQTGEIVAVDGTVIKTEAPLALHPWRHAGCGGHRARRCGGRSRRRGLRSRAGAVKYGAASEVPHDREDHRRKVLCRRAARAHRRPCRAAQARARHHAGPRGGDRRARSGRARSM